MDFVNLNGRKLNMDGKRYYNLNTSRLVKDIPLGSIVSKDFRVVGSFEQLHKFAQLNNLEPKDVLPSEYWEDELICNYGATRSDDVERVSDDELSQLSEFSLMGLNLKARILDVIDGDTVSLAVFVPLMELSQLRIGKIGRYFCRALPFRHSVGFIARFRCRLQGIDTAEKNTEKGVVIRERLISIFEKTNNIVYSHFYEPDKYGRQLVRLYSHPKSKQSINEELLTYKGHTNVYHGGKKEAFVTVEKRSFFRRFFHGFGGV